MKYPVSVIALCCLSLAGAGQSGRSLSSLPGVVINLRESNPSIPGAFRHFEVIDERADTARIGVHDFIPAILGHPRSRQLIFPQPAATEIAGYLNKRFSRSDAPWSALIVLRNLWLSDATFSREDKMKDPAIHRTHIRLKAEIYAYNDSFFVPILRFDTLQTYKRNNPYNNLRTYYSLWEDDLTAVLGEMTDSASDLAPARISTGRRLQREDIIEFNQSRFEPPITGSAVLTPGAYASFQEFRNNAPSIQNFEVHQQNEDYLLYITNANGPSQYSREAWGYCDGKTVYIMREGKLYPLWKEGKAFYWAIRRIYTLDMDSGHVY